MKLKHCVIVICIREHRNAKFVLIFNFDHFYHLVVCELIFRADKPVARNRIDIHTHILLLDVPDCIGIMLFSPKFTIPFLILFAAGTEQTTRIIKNVTDIYHNIRIRGGHSVNKHCFHGLYAESCISNRKFFICYSNVVYNACIRLIRLLKSLLVQAVHTNRLKTILNIHKKLYYIHFFCRFICCYIIIIANIQKFFGLL